MKKLVLFVMVAVMMVLITACPSNPKSAESAGDVDTLKVEAVAADSLATKTVAVDSLTTEAVSDQVKVEK
jgi:ABC-type phosphate/phosphonate transport system substrate-binding protein